MHLQSTLNVGPDGAMVTGGDDGRQSSQGNLPSLSLVGSSSTLSDTLPQVQETVLFSPDNATAISPPRDVYNSPIPSPSSNTPQPPPATPETATFPVFPATVTLTESPPVSSQVDQPSQAAPSPVTMTIQPISISESISTLHVFESAHDDEISAINPKTVLVPTTTTINAVNPSIPLSGLPTRSSSGSSSSLSTFPVTTNTAGSSHSSARHGAPFYVGLGLLCVLAVCIVSTFIAWLIRTRSRRNKDFQKMTWSWDPEKSPRAVPSVDGDASNENVHSLYNVPMTWNFSRERDVGDPKRSNSFENPLPLAARSISGGMGLGTPHLLPAHLRTPFISVTDPTYSSRSTPEIPHTLGPLTITNMMPGDVSMSSRNGHSQPGSEFGTPNEKMAGTVPRFMGLGGGLSVPWTPRSIADEAIPQSSSSRPSRTSVQNLKTRFHYKTDSSDNSPAPDSWTSSLKSNLTSAFNAVVGATTSSSKPDSQDDPYTRVHPHSMHKSVLGMDWHGEGTGSLTRQSTASTVRGYSMEETGDGKGVVHVHGLPTRPPLSVLGGVKRSSNFTVRSGYAITEEPDDQDLEPELFSRASSVYSAVSSNSERLFYTLPVPPRLPSLPPTRALTMRTKVSKGENVVDSSRSDDAWKAFAEMMKERKSASGVSMNKMSRESTVSSVGTSISRQSSEREAERVLKIRRSRAMAVRRSGVGRGTMRRTSVRRAGSKMSSKSRIRRR